MSRIPLLRLCSLLGLALLLPISAWAQGTIRGTVTEVDTGDPLPGVTVSIRALNIGAVTNVEGEYSISSVAPGEHQIEARFVGYEVIRRRVNVPSGQTVTVDFELGESVLEMEEVVVTGTGGNARRREIGTSIEQVTAAEIEAAPIADFGDILQGRAAGVTVLDNSGMVGAGSTIRLRGNNSIAMGNDPLIYIDGIRVFNENYIGDPELNQAPNPLNDINPDDIERIEIVKGAAATTLYGTEAAGGVIQIFTKRGVRGKPQWTFSTSQGIYDMQHLGPDKNVNPTGLGLNNCNYTDGDGNEDSLFPVDPSCPSSGSWFRNGHTQRYNLSARGGNESVTYFVSGQFSDRQGVIDPQGNAEYSVRSNFGFSPLENLNVQFNNFYSRSRTTWLPDGNNAEGMLLNVIRGKRGYTPNNQDALVLDMNLRTTSNHFTSGFAANYTPTNRMVHQLNAGVDYSEVDYTEERPWGYFYVPEGDRENDRATYRVMTLDYNGSYIFKPLTNISSSTSWGGQLYSRDFFDLNGFGEKFAGPGDKVVDSGAITESFESRISTASGGFFLQQRVGFMDRLFLTGGIRFDGHSAFGNDFGLAPYPKVSASYVLSDHAFWPSQWETLKLRAAYGESGKAPDVFSAIRFWDSVSGDEGEPAVTPSNLGNPDLGPERTREVELGFETALMGGRVYAEFTYYTQRTYDALVAVQPTPSNGIPDTQLQNVGELTNKGIEASLDLRVLTGRDFSWTIGGHYATNFSNVEDIGGLESISIGWRQYIRPGYPVPAFFHDVVQNPNEVGVNPVMEEDFLGPVYPTHNYAINTELTLFRDLKLNVLGEGQGGHVLSSGTAYQNVRRKVWPGCAAIQAKIDAGDTAGLTAEEQANCNTRFTTYGMWTRAADFFKLRSVSLSYRMPRKFLPAQVRGLTMRLQARNLLTFTDYPGLDPEVYEDGSAGALYRQEYYNLPSPRSFQLTLKLDV